MTDLLQVEFVPRRGLSRRTIVAALVSMGLLEACNGRSAQVGGERDAELRDGALDSREASHTASEEAGAGMADASARVDAGIGASDVLVGQSSDPDEDAWEDAGSSCLVPSAPVPNVIRAGAVIRFAAPTGSKVQVGSSRDDAAPEPDEWEAGDSFAFELEPPVAVKVFARIEGNACQFEHTYDVRRGFAPSAGSPGSTAVASDSQMIVGWASDYERPVDYGMDVDAMWQTPDKALGPASADPLDTVALGNHGSIVLLVETPITDGVGPDFAVFENAFNDTFLELAFVEVSSDGVHFERFDSAYLGAEPIDAFGAVDPEMVDGLAGKYRLGFGTPFDLHSLRYRPSVQSGQLNLSAITHVRIVDVVGDGSARDSFGRTIYDPTPTVGSGGFDLEALAILHSAQE